MVEEPRSATGFPKWSVCRLALYHEGAHHDSTTHRYWPLVSGVAVGPETRATAEARPPTEGQVAFGELARARGESAARARANRALHAENVALHAQLDDARRLVDAQLVANAPRVVLPRGPIEAHTANAGHPFETMSACTHSALSACTGSFVCIHTVAAAKALGLALSTTRAELVALLFDCGASLLDEVREAAALIGETLTVTSFNDVAKSRRALRDWLQEYTRRRTEPKEGRVGSC